MCAIAGIIDFDGRDLPIDEEKLLDAMAGQGTYRRGPARLAVVDPDGVRQPLLLSARGGLALAYDGELYNAAELRNVLAGLGHRFAGHSDAEVAARAYAEWGEDCVKRFNGIFAFAVWEEEHQRLFLARDRMGVKPLFFALAEGWLCFASEVKALPECGPFRNIRELEGGCCGCCTKTGWRTWRYWMPEGSNAASGCGERQLTR